MTSKKRVVIVGGGIAGTTCAEYVSSFASNVDIILIVANDMIKTAVTTRKVSEMIQEIDVSETAVKSFESQFHAVSVLVGFVKEVNTDEKVVLTSKGELIKYDKLCVCTGGKPNLMNVEKLTNNPYVSYIRDTDTVKELQKRLSKARKIVVIGNGGIAMELVYEIVGCEVIWCVKHDHVGNSFFDKSASAFLLPSLEEEIKKNHERKADKTIFRRKKYHVDREFLNKGDACETVGSALGPDWSTQQYLCGLHGDSSEHNVQVIYCCEPKRIFSETKTLGSDFNVCVELNNGKTIGTDFVVCATGVTPNFPKFISNITLEKYNEGICVDSNMRTNIQDVYAAGDVCSASWEYSNHWFPMKLWTQGWQMGAFAGKCIAEHVNKNADLPLDFCFELFTHVTTFFGYKVCLLGDYNCQKLNGNDCELLLRCTTGVEYIKLVIMNGRVQGAILIGETDLEETIENLILNQIDIGFLGESLLDPDIDIEDYFD